MIAFFALIHTFAHYVNYMAKPVAVETAFDVARWYVFVLNPAATYLAVGLELAGSESSAKSHRSHRSTANSIAAVLLIP